MDRSSTPTNVDLTTDLSGLLLTDRRDTYYDTIIPELVDENDSELVSETQDQDRLEHGQTQTQTQHPSDFLTVTAPFRGRGIPTLEGPLREAKRSVVSDLGHELRLSVRTRTESLPLSYDSKAGDLDSALDRATETSAVSKLGFIPNGQLMKLINEDTVTAELKRCRDSIRKRIIRTYNFKEPKLTDEQLAQEATKICAASEDRKSYRKIMAILLLIDRPSRIRRFVAEGVSDQDLPLEMIKIASTKRLKRTDFDLRRKGDPNTPLQCFRVNDKKWRNSTLERFEKYQWCLLAPFLSRDGPRVLRFPLPDQAILPFRTWEKIGQQGGFSQVYKAEIHPDHHGFHIQHLHIQDQDQDEEHGHEVSLNHPSTRSNVFAVKRLNSQNKNDFRHEFDMHKRVSKNLHKHLIPLLAAYEQHGLYHLIFPLAEADLEKYWRVKNKFPEPTEETARWVAEQCQGLAGAVAAIHRSYTLSGSLDSPTTLPEGRREGETQVASINQGDDCPRPRAGFRLAGHCRHGDIKPKNILWFSHNARGTLKITDFGAAQYAEHRVPSNVTQTTPIYRPPEADLTAQGTEPDVIVGTSYDIWSLGCVFLEFVAWFLGGWDGVESFLEKRSAATVDSAIHNFRTGKFFLIESADPNETGKTSQARVKPEVHKFINEVQSNPATSNFFHDFLTLVRDEMLVIEEDIPGSRRRSSAANIETRLAEMVREGRSSPGYFYSQPANGYHTLNGGISSEVEKDGIPTIYLHEGVQLPLATST